MKKKIAILSHMVHTDNVLKLPPSKVIQKKYLEMMNFNRILTSENCLVDHMEYIKGLRGLSSESDFSVWDIMLCSGLILSAHLKKNGFNVKLVNCIESSNKTRLFKSIQSFQPHIIVVSSSQILSENHLAYIVQQMRVIQPEAFIIAGGHHVCTSLQYKDKADRLQYFKKINADVLVNDSQGETTLIKICRAFPDTMHEIPNILYRENGSIMETERVPENNNINESLLDFTEVKEASLILLRTARSCSFQCSFCSYPSYAGKLSLMDIEVVIAMLKNCKEKNVKAIFFSDDTFNVPRERFGKLLDRMIEDKIVIPWYSFIRCQYLDEELVKKMKATGCVGVFLGIESGSNKLLENMNKKARVEHYRNGISWLKKEEILTVGSFVIGFPGETLETVEKTKEFIESSELDFYYIQPFYYLHNSKVHEQAGKYKLSGEGLFWSHYSMNSKTAMTCIYRLFLDIKNSIWINPDYTLWMLGYLLGKGIPFSTVREYCRQINNKTAHQIREYLITEKGNE